jgi:hypothetical protein
MKIAIQPLLIIFFLGLYVSSFGQANLDGSADVAKFPEINFQVHMRDPAPRDSADFEVKEDKVAIPFKMEIVNSDAKPIPRGVLVLWEFLPNNERSAQNEYFRSVLQQAIPKMLGEGDVLNIATFAWTDKANGDGMLELLAGGFQENTEGLLEAVKNAKSPSGQGVKTDHGSELYRAMNEGVAVLASQKDKSKVLVVLSAEFPNIFNVATENATKVIAEARQADVAVHNLRFKLKDPKYNLDDVSRSTFGQSFEVDKKDASASASKLNQFVSEAGIRALGKDYNFIATTTNLADGKSHHLQLKCGTEILDIPYNAPSASIGDWIKENAIVFGIILVLAICVVVALLLLVRARKKASDIAKALELDRLKDIESKNRQSEGLLSQQRLEIDRLKSAEAAKEEAGKAVIAQAEMTALYQAMFANGKSPRVVANVNGTVQTIPLPSPVTTVGRDKSSDIQIDSNAVSRNHFQVIFQNGTYTLQDIGSTNGTYLNGIKITQSPLRHGDVIGAGGLTFNFFI